MSDHGFESDLEALEEHQVGIDVVHDEYHDKHGDGDDFFSDEEVSDDEEFQGFDDVEEVDLKQELDVVVHHLTRDKKPFQDLDPRTVEHLLTENPQDQNAPTALHCLAGNEVHPVLEPLVSHLVKEKPTLLLIKGDWDMTPLALAVKNQRTNMATWICEHAAKSDIEAVLAITNRLGQGCLELALLNGLRDLAKMFIHLTPAVNACARNEAGLTPLHVAVEYRLCREGQLDVVRKLVEKTDSIMKGDLEFSSNSKKSSPPESPYQFHKRTARKYAKDLATRQAGLKASSTRTSSSRIKKSTADMSHGAASRGSKPPGLTATPLVPSGGATRRDKGAEEKGLGGARHGDRDRGFKGMKDTRESRDRPHGPNQLDRKATLRLDVLSVVSSSARDSKDRRIAPGSAMKPPPSPSLTLTGEKYPGGGEMNRRHVSSSQNDKAVRSSKEKERERDNPGQKNLTVPSSSSRGGSSRTPTVRDAHEQWARGIEAFLKLHYIRNRNANAAHDLLFGLKTSSDRHLYFDASGYTGSGVSDMVEMVDSLATSGNFLDTLSYVELPQLVNDRPPSPSTASGSTSGRRPALANSKRTRERVDKDFIPLGRTGLKEVFQKLHEKGVRKIIRVIVTDLESPAHTDQVIEEALHGKEVEIWDWQRWDTCSDTIFAASDKVRIMNLFWSGHPSVLKEWRDGLLRFKDLVKITISVHQGLETKDRTTKAVKEFERSIQSNTSGRAKVSWKFSTRVPGGASTGNDPDSRLGMFDDAPKHKWLAAMDRFRTALRNIDTNSGPEVNDPIKVAVIDDGINMREIADYHVNPIHGYTFCPRGSELSHPWYQSSGGHGTAMARQILRLNPWAEIHMAKLEDRPNIDGTMGISIKSAAESIEKAIQWNVQVISMSWTIQPPLTRTADCVYLESAIRKAHDAGILMFCSAADDISATEDVYPYKAASDCVFRIGAADASGQRDNYVNAARHVDFVFPGIQVAEDQRPSRSVPGGNRGASSPREIKYLNGSSVSTALAAGLASLILYCSKINLQLAKKGAAGVEDAEAKHKSLSLHKTMDQAFRNIGQMEDSGSKFLTVWKVFGTAAEKMEKMPIRSDRLIEVAGVAEALCPRY